MNKVKIITDCTSDLIDDFYEKLNIHNLSLYINIGGKSYRDKLDISPTEMFEKVEEFKELPKTAALTPNDFIEVFSKYIKEGYDCIYIGLGSGFSSTFQSAVIAQDTLEAGTVELVDSENLSSGIGLLLLKAVKFRDEGMSAKEIKEKLDALVPRVRSMFSINTLEYLHKGGRCSGTTRVIGTILKIKPIIRVVDNAMIVAKKPRGKYKSALDAQLDYLYKDKDNIDLDNIFITHCLAKDKDINYLLTEIKRIVPEVKNIHITTASSVISTHCGPRTIGILYIKDEEN